MSAMRCGGSSHQKHESTGRFSACPLSRYVYSVVSRPPVIRGRLGPSFENLRRTSFREHEVAPCIRRLAGLSSAMNVARVARACRASPPQANNRRHVATGSPGRSAFPTQRYSTGRYRLFSCTAAPLTLVPSGLLLILGPREADPGINGDGPDVVRDQFRSGGQCCASLD